MDTSLELLLEQVNRNNRENYKKLFDKMAKEFPMAEAEEERVKVLRDLNDYESEINIMFEDVYDDLLSKSNKAKEDEDIFIDVDNDY